MAKFVTRKTDIVGSSPGKREAAQVISSQAQAETPDTVAYILYFVSGLIEALLAFRFVFKITGANPGSGFVDLIYSVSGLLILPFEGIFRRTATQGIEVTAIFEPATLVAMGVYAIATWGIMHLIAIASGKPPQE